MKYIVILGDGMADYKLDILGNKTPLEAANKPNIDLLAQKAEIGLVKTVPDSLSPGSDTANLSVMGYDPLKYYSGRSPLEAVSMGIDLSSTDVTYRCNLVTLSDEIEYDKKTMIDYSSDEISTGEAQEIITFLNSYFKTETINFYNGISYRHCLVVKNGNTGIDFTPPHDILEKKIADYLPKGDGSEFLYSMMKRSNELLKDHPVNIKRIKNGLNPVTSIWLWGEGKKPAIPSFFEKYGIAGSVISAVDLIKGIGVCAKMRVVDVEGATGNIHTNFSGKAQAAIIELKNYSDFVYLHIEAPDECGHRFEIDNKVKSIELIDELVVKPIVKYLEESGEDFGILILPDHPTPLSLRTHTRDPVPYLLFKSNINIVGQNSYTEELAKNTGIYVNNGYEMLDKLFLNSN